MPDAVAAAGKIQDAIAAQKSARWKYLTDRHAELVTAWKADEAKYRSAAALVPTTYLSHFEAENFDGVHNLRIAQLVKDGSGSDVIESMVSNDQWVKYRVTVPDDGSYQLDAFYNTDEKTPLLVQVNGASVSADALSAPTGGWDLVYQRWQPVATFDLRSGLNFLRLYAKAGTFPRIGRFRLRRIDAKIESQIQQIARAQGLDTQLLAEFMMEPDHPWPTIAGMEAFLNPAQQSAIAAMDAEMARLAGSMQPYELTVSVCDDKKPIDLPIHIRGDVYNVSSQSVPRNMPRLLDAVLPRPAIPADHSGRLELAQWLTDPRIR